MCASHAVNAGRFRGIRGADMDGVGGVALMCGRAKALMVIPGYAVFGHEADRSLDFAIGRHFALSKSDTTGWEDERGVFLYWFEFE